MAKLSLRTIVALVLLCIGAFFLFYDFGDKEPAEGRYRQSDGVVFGTTYHITYKNADGAVLDGAIRNATAAVNSSLSMFAPGSTISKVNSGELTDVSADGLFLKVFRAGMAVSKATGGAFDMTVAPLVDLWGFGLKNRSEVTQAQVDSAMRCVGYTLISEHDGRIGKQSACVRLDAGAIAKGFACDVVLDTLIAHGCTDACVEIGGEVAVTGVNPKGKPWRIGINKPVDDSLSVASEVYAVATLEGRGMATSGNYRNYYEMDGRKYSHTIDPVSGRPVTHNLLSATVVAADCMTADAWATACMVLGLDSAKALVEANPALDAFLIYDSAGVMKTWATATFPIDK